MAKTRRTTSFSREIADLIASTPTREQILSFHPSEQVQQRVRDLLEKLRANRLTAEEEWELNQFEHAEVLIQLVKARVRAGKATVS
jgi:hypothetical protein